MPTYTLEEQWANYYNITPKGARVMYRLYNRGSITSRHVNRIRVKHEAMPAAMVRQLTTADGRIKSSNPNITFLKGKEGGGF